MNDRFFTNNKYLRDRAERLLDLKSDELAFVLPDEAKAVIHELQVHQIELSLQNEELIGAQQALEESRARYMHLFHQAPVGYVVLDSAGLISEANFTFAELAGRERGQLLGRPFVECIHPEDRPVYFARAKALFKHPGNKQLDLRLNVNGRAVRHASLRVTDTKPFPLLSSSNSYALLLIVTDITARIQAEAALRLSEQLARTTVDALSAHIAILDDQGMIIAVNRAWRDFAQANRIDPASVAEGVNYLQLCAAVLGNEKEEAQDFAEGIRGVLRGDYEVYTQEYSCHSPSEPRWFLGRVTRFHSTEGPRVMLTHENITARKQFEEHILQINSQLEKRVEERTHELQQTQRQYLHAEKLSAIGKLSASIAHELNNPLQGILSILKGLDKRAILEIEDRELLMAAIGEVDRIRDLLRSLQDFNRPSSGRKVPMDIHKSLDSILLLHRNDFKNKGIVVERQYGENLPALSAVPDQIKQVFLNLLANAADACRSTGGRITIRTRQEGEQVAVAIKDNGIGIAEENKDLIFQPFFTTKQEVKGTGLGLSVSYGIIRSHKGTIEVDSQPGHGATFTIRLPIFDQSELEPMVASQPEERGNTLWASAGCQGEQLLDALGNEFHPHGRHDQPHQPGDDINAGLAQYPVNNRGHAQQ